MEIDQTNRGQEVVAQDLPSDEVILTHNKRLGTSLPTGDLSAADIDRIIEMAWEDRTPFDAITAQFGLKEAEVIALMRREMKASSWRMWRARVQGRRTKHRALSPNDMDTFRCNRQRMITHNKISKR